MTQPQPPAPDSRSSAWRRHDEVLQRFEDAWYRGQRPDLNHFLPADTPERRTLLLDLVRIDLEFRLKAQEPVRVESYLERFPELAGDGPGVLDLLAWEYTLRRRAEPGLSVEEYVSRFPHLSTELAARLRDVESSRPELNTPASSAAGTPRPAGEAATGWPAPATGPRYQALRLHARGGLGEVFLAQDTVLHRDVALKRMQERHLDHADSRRRFLREAEITGRLEHPGIVPVHDLHFDAAGQPCYVMRFIQGETLKEACERYHHGEPPPGEPPGLARRDGGDQPRRSPSERRLQFRQLLNHFVAACNAVAYAHSRGVLHRDLKPANILLGKFGETLVVDWGLAKIAGRTEATRTNAEGTMTTAEEPAGDGTALGQALGTPAYMSPEQAVGRWNVVGPASDVYGLGATLYQVLTGQVPLAGTDRQEVLARVQRGAWPRPRQVNAVVPRALEAICLKAMALEPAERYATATALAAEVEHWLADEPVAAYREPWPTRLVRWGRRHRAWTAGAAALLVAAVLGLAGGLAAVERERQQTAVERDQKEQALAAESAAREQAMAALRAMTDDVMEQQLARRGQLTAEERAYLQKVLSYYERFAVLQGDDATRRSLRAEGYARVGLVRYRLGELPEAEAAYREALTLLNQLAADFLTRPDFRQELAGIHNNLGILLRDTGRLKEAEAAYREALTLLEQLVAESPTRPDARSALAKGHLNLGVLLQATGRLAEAEVACREALALQEQLVADFPDQPDFRHELAMSHNSLGTFLKETGRPQDAEAAYREALTLQKRLATEFPTRPDFRQDLAKSHNNLGILLRDTGRLKEAEAAHREALTLKKQLAADFPTRPDFRQELATSHHNLGFLLNSAGRQAEAEAAYRDALALQKQLAADFPDRTAFRVELARSHDNLGILLRATGRPQEAEAAYREGLALRRRLAADSPTRTDFREDLARSYNNLGNLLRDMGRPLEAETVLRDALALWRQLAADFPTVPDYRNGLANTLGNLARLLRDRRDFAAARQALQEALLHHQAALKANPRHPTYHRFYRNNLSILVSTLAGLRDQAAAVATAQTRRDLGWDSAGDAYAAAWALADSISIVEKDEQLSPEERREQARFYADQAMAMLRQAVAKGWKDAAHLKKDKDLDPLRSREDFQKLLAELEKK